MSLTNRRELAKKGKDALYVHDALRLFTRGAQLAPSVVEQARRLRQRLTRRQRAKLSENVGKLSLATTDFFIEAARQARGRSAAHSPEVIALVLKLGLAELLD